MRATARNEEARLALGEPGHPSRLTYRIPRRRNVTRRRPGMGWVRHARQSRARRGPSSSRFHHQSGTRFRVPKHVASDLLGLRRANHVVGEAPVVAIGERQACRPHGQECHLCRIEGSGAEGRTRGSIQRADAYALSAGLDQSSPTTTAAFHRRRRWSQIAKMNPP